MIEMFCSLTINRIASMQLPEFTSGSLDLSCLFPRWEGVGEEGETNYAAMIERV